MRRLPSWVLLALLGLGGCSTTVFETIPTGTTTACDPAWPGRWQPVATTKDASGDEAKSQDAVEISADCRSMITKGERKPLHLTLITTRTGQYLQVHNDDGEPDCIGAGKAHCGYVLVRYARDGDVIRVYEPDHARMAAAIAKGAIEGFSERSDDKAMKTSEPVHRNFIAGNSKQVDTVLRRHPEMFGAEPLVVLHRIASEPAPADEAGAEEPAPPASEH